MSRLEIDLNPVTFITVDAIGQPGERVFYLQGRSQDQVVTLLVEKYQIQTLALAIENLMVELQEKVPDLAEASPDYNEEAMMLEAPLDPLFRVGELSLGYQHAQDVLVLIAREVPTAMVESDDKLSEVRFWCTRSQIWAMGRWSIDLAGRGRPVWPSTGEPILPPGEFSPKNNGHKTTP
ncbi:MAG: DUF3090 family protein [Chloroflexi bacterium]|jgi:uncharacterized repeat protein (TIGR03847 family)|nr:DUF3090 family protein [Chloroflexota bacterium]